MDLPNCCIRLLLCITLRGGNDLDILAARDAVRGVRLLTFAVQYSNDPTKTALSSVKGCSCAIARRRISGSPPLWPLAHVATTCDPEGSRPVLELRVRLAYKNVRTTTATGA